jgi:protein associated with RNAse G/E
VKDIHVVYRKYDGSLHWHMTMGYLGEDEHGVWVGTGPGNTMRKGDGPVVPIPHPNIGVLPRDGWWTGWFNGEPERVDIYCDITTPPQWPTPGEVTMIDLDLDVCRRREDGSVHLLDEDEFETHQRLYAYPQEVIASAAQTAAFLHEAISQGAEPFSKVYRSWFTRLSSG